MLPNNDEGIWACSQWCALIPLAASCIQMASMPKHTVSVLWRRNLWIRGNIGLILVIDRCDAYAPDQPGPCCWLISGHNLP